MSGVSVSTDQIKADILANTAAAFGVGQTWQDVIASRSANVTYTNTTGKPITVAIAQTSNGVQLFYVNGVLVMRNDTGTATNVSSGFCYVIPNGQTYKCSSKGTYWFELR